MNAPALQMSVVITGRNKEVETQIANAVRSEPVSRTGGRVQPRELVFQLNANRKEAINARMRVYLLMKKLDQPVTVHIPGLPAASE